jgi:hypothetical protein
MARVSAFAHSHSVRPHQIHLHFADLIAGNPYIREFPNPSGDGVGSLVVPY